MPFKQLGLRPEILNGIKLQGYTEPTPIQEKAIPVILKGKDILAKAQTGTGKTAAFTLPLLHILSTDEEPKNHHPRALVLAPTRELAAQVAKSVETYGHGLHLRSIAIFGGVGVNPQIQKLHKGIDIVIGTPGRLLDLAEQKALNLSEIEVLILDEADRMLDMGFIHDIRKIIRMVPKKRQTLFFSATYSEEIKKLADSMLKQPVLTEVKNQDSAPDTVIQYVYEVPKCRKQELLSHLIKDGNWNQILVFAKTKFGANRLAKQLNKDGITALAIHGNKSQAARTLALKNFKEYKTRVLVGTDVAARGLDIDRLPHVINYELPFVPEDYVHRIGRTGRAGNEGEAISLVSKEEMKLLRSIERLLRKHIPIKTIEGFSKPREDSHNKNRSLSQGYKRREPSRGGRSNNSRNNNSKETRGNYRGGNSEAGSRSNYRGAKPEGARSNYRGGNSAEGNRSNYRSARPEGTRNNYKGGNSEAGSRSNYRGAKPESARGNYRGGNSAEGNRNNYRSARPEDARSNYRGGNSAEGNRSNYRGARPEGTRSNYKGGNSEAGSRSNYRGASSEETRTNYRGGYSNRNAKPGKSKSGYKGGKSTGAPKKSFWGGKPNVSRTPSSNDKYKRPSKR